jgi:large subunit ribosomal protein L34
MIGPFKKRKRLRSHGFLNRLSTVDGQKVLRARRRKGRHVLAVSYPNRVKNIRGKSKHHIIAGGTARIVTYPGLTERFRAPKEQKAPKAKKAA